MKLKLLAMVMAICLMTAPGCVVYSSGGGWSDYSYYELPQGYHYEYWEDGPVIVNTLTGALVTWAVLEAMFPHWRYRPLHHTPHFVRDWRIPAHRAHWGHRPHVGGRHGFRHMGPPPMARHHSGGAPKIGPRHHAPRPHMNAPQHHNNRPHMAHPQGHQMHRHSGGHPGQPRHNMGGHRDGGHRPDMRRHEGRGGGHGQHGGHGPGHNGGRGNGHGPHGGHGNDRPHGGR